MELKKGFTDFLAEAKDSQKSKENADMTKNDASHGEKSTTLDPKVKGDGNTYEGDKADNLDPSINEDAQKAKENADMKKNDASHGEKATVVKEGDEKGKVLHGEKEGDDEGKLDESLSSTERDIIKDNASRKRGEHVLIKGKEDSETFIVHAASSSITYVKHASGNVMIYSLDRSGKNVIYLDDEDISFINKNV